MGIFRRSRPVDQVEDRTATLGALQAILDRSNMTAAGVSVTQESALSSSAVWACLELIAGVGSTLPLDEFTTKAGTQVAVNLSCLLYTSDAADDTR